MEVQQAEDTAMVQPPGLHERIIREVEAPLISAALATNTPKFIFLGSSCIYPKMAPQPLKEEYLLTGPLEPTNEGYALAKITGVKLCEAARKQLGKDYLSLMPTNLYGPNDNFDLKTSHVLPALIRKFHEAKENDHAPVTLWGTGSPMREFLHVDDLARAVATAATGVVLVSNEVGAGIVPENRIARLYRDLAGWTNQAMAAACDRVIWTVAGIPVTIKPSPPGCAP